MYDGRKTRLYVDRAVMDFLPEAIFDKGRTAILPTFLVICEASEEAKLVHQGDVRKIVEKAQG